MSPTNAAKPEAEKRPRVTVLMPVYNGEPHLREAIESVLSQDFADFEFVIVNDGSTDRSREIALSFGDSRIRLVDNPQNMGLVRSLNRGIEEARGEWIVRMDADDRRHPRSVGDQLEFAERHDLDVCFCDRINILPNGATEHPRETRTPWARRRWQSLFRNSFGAHPAVCYRRQAVIDVGAYREEFPYAEEYDLWHRMAETGLKFGYLRREYVYYRKHEVSMTATYPERYREYTTRITNRSMRRIVPDLTDDRAESLSWLLSGEWVAKSKVSRREGLELVEALALRFFEIENLNSAGQRDVWADVADSLCWRIHKMRDRRETWMCICLWARAALRARWKYRFPGIRLVLYSFQKARLVLESRAGKRR